MVVTSDPQAREMAERIAGARVVPDHAPPRGMNAAVVRGLEEVAGAGAEGALVLTADLPLARPEDLEAVLAAAPPGPGAVFVPSVARHRHQRHAAAPAGRPHARASASTRWRATAPRPPGAAWRWCSASAPPWPSTSTPRATWRP